MTVETITAVREFENRNLAGAYGNSSSFGASRADGFEIETTRQVIWLWIDNESQCCEQHGYFWSNESAQEFIGAELRAVTRTDTSLNTKRLEREDGGRHAFEEKATLFVNIETDRGILQFTAYNAHNGFYGHDAGVVSQQLCIKEQL